MTPADRAYLREWLEQVYPMFYGCPDGSPHQGTVLSDALNRLSHFAAGDDGWRPPEPTYAAATWAKNRDPDRPFIHYDGSRHKVSDRVPQ